MGWANSVEEIPLEADGNPNISSIGCISMEHNAACEVDIQLHRKFPAS
jgi:hypothetical protein